MNFPNFWVRVPKTHEQLQAELYASVGPVDMDMIPSGSEGSELPGGYQVNLIRMIQDHAPGRLDTIEKHIKEHQLSITKLQYEADKLRSVLKAVEHG
jgi:hypothetical protein